MDRTDDSRTGERCFGLFTLDLRSGELRKGVRVQEQPIKVLAALVDRPGEVVRASFPDQSQCGTRDVENSILGLCLPRA